MRDELVKIVRLLLGLSPAVMGDLPSPDTQNQDPEHTTSSSPE